MPQCFICQSEASRAAQFNGRCVAVCDPCLTRVTPACPACGRAPRKTRSDAPTLIERHARHDQRVLQAITEDLSWRAIVRASGLSTSDAQAARERLIASGVIELKCAHSGTLGARYRVR